MIASHPIFSIRLTRGRKPSRAFIRWAEKTHCGGFGLKPVLRTALFLSFVWAVIAIFANLACAQQIDVAVGGSSMYAPPGSQAFGNHNPESLNGGTYPSVSADYLFFRGHTGVQGEIAWRWNNSTYLPGNLNLPFKPLFYDFNAIYVSKPIRRRFAIELLGGAGVQNTRFYVQACKGSACYGTTNHFMVDFGGGIKYYVWRHFFLRPEGRYFLVRNNTEFSSDHAVRYGASIGYTFR